METLLTAIVTWLSIGFGLPATYAHPRVELVSPEKMNVIQLRARTPAHAHAASVAGSQPEHPTAQRNTKWSITCKTLVA